MASQGFDRAPHRRKASRIGNPPFLQWFGGANDLRSQGIRVGAHALDPGRAATRRQNPAPVRPAESITLARAGGISWHQVGSAVLKRRSSGGTRFCRGSHAARFRAHGCSSLKIWVASVGRTRPGRFRKNAIERLRRYDLTRVEPRRLRRRRRGANRVNRRANTVHLAWTTGRADRAAK